MKKSELLARIQALEARVIALEARPTVYPSLLGPWPRTACNPTPIGTTGVALTGVVDSVVAQPQGGFLPGGLGVGAASAQ